MKNGRVSFNKQFTYSVVVLMLLLMTIPALAEDITIATSITDSSLEVGDEFHVFIRLNLDNAPSTGGYIDVVFNDSDLKCIEVVNYDIFGQGIMLNQSCPESGTIRITSMASSFADAKTFPSGEMFAAVTFQAMQIVASTDIEFAVTSQIFGTRGGDILTSRDDSATNNVLIAAAQIPQPEPTDPPANPTEPPEPPTEPTEPPANPTEPLAEAITNIPEPSSILLVLSGLAALWCMRKRQR